MTSQWPLFADSHVHLFQRGFHGDLPEGEEFARYVSHRERFGIGRALVIGYEGQPQFLGNNEYIRELSRQHDWLIPLRYVGTDTLLLSHLEDGFRGYAVYLDDWPPDTDAAEHLGDIARAATTTPPVVSINGTPEMFARALSSLLGFVGCKILVSHLGLPGDVAPTPQHAMSRLRPLVELAEQTDLYVKISGSYSFDSSDDGAWAATFVDGLVEAIGVERLLWGSDFAPALDHQSVEQTFALPRAVESLFSPEEYQLVMSGNLLRLLGEN